VWIWPHGGGKEVTRFNLAESGDDLLVVMP
jgi:hypothetical protein